MSFLKKSGNCALTWKFQKLWRFLNFTGLKCERHVCVCVHTQSCQTVCNHVDCSPPGSFVHGNFPDKNNEVHCHFLLQGIFLTQGLNLRLFYLLHWQMGSLPLVPPGRPFTLTTSCHITPRTCNELDANQTSVQWSWHSPQWFILLTYRRTLFGKQHAKNVYGSRERWRERRKERFF